MIWSFVLIPIIAIAALLIFFRERLLWWEAPALLLTVMILIFIMAGVTNYIGTSDTEWLSDKVTKVEFHEKYVREWQEWVPATGHYDKDNNYVVDVPAHFETRTESHPDTYYKCTNSDKYRIDVNEYHHIKGIWKNEIYQELTHPDQRHSMFCPEGRQCNCKDGRGDMFYVKWSGKFEETEAVTWTKTYENRIQSSHSVFNYEEVDEETAKTLYQLPKPDSNHNIQSILGVNGPITNQANKSLMAWNSLIGPRPGPDSKYKQAGRIWLLVFKNRPQQDAILQERMLKGGNKNEFIICVGTDNEFKIKWSYIISWTKNERLKIDVRDFINNQIDEKLNLQKIIDFSGRACYNGFQRREFEEFSYLENEPSTLVLIFTFLVIIILTTALSVYVVVNEADGSTRDVFVSANFKRIVSSRSNFRDRCRSSRFSKRN